MQTASEISISIVIPTLHRADSVDRLLASLLRQNFDLSKVEVIVAMNEKDESQEKRLESWKDRLNIKHCFTGERSASKARNHGISLASGAIVFLLDDDMELIQTDILQKHFDYHQDEQLIGLGGACAMPMQTSIQALAYHIIGLTWMIRYCNADSITPYLLGAHASYKRKVFEQGFYFNEEIKFGAEETEFNLSLYNAGMKLKYVRELRPIHHNDVQTRGFIKKAYLQGYYSALRKKNSGRPQVYMKHQIALAKISEEEAVTYWQKPLLKIYYRLYDWAANQGRRHALGEEQLMKWRQAIVRYLVKANKELL